MQVVVADPARPGLHRARLVPAIGGGRHLGLGAASEVRRAIDQSYPRCPASRATSASSSSPAPRRAITIAPPTPARGRRERAGRPGREPDRHAGAARPRVRRAHRAAWATGCGCGSASTARCTRCSTLPAGDGPGAREPHQDHGRHEHRRAPPPAGRPDRDERRRPRARRPRRDHADDLRREGGAAAARQAAARCSGSSELGMPADTHERFSGPDRSPYGMVICAGPTGSGKTTTLYADAVGDQQRPSATS